MLTAELVPWRSATSTRTRRSTTSVRRPSVSDHPRPAQLTRSPVRAGNPYWKARLDQECRRALLIRHVADPHLPLLLPTDLRPLCHSPARPGHGPPPGRGVLRGVHTAVALDQNAFLQKSGNNEPPASPNLSTMRRYPQLRSAVGIVIFSHGGAISSVRAPPCKRSSRPLVSSRSSHSPPAQMPACRPTLERLALVSLDQLPSVPVDGPVCAAIDGGCGVWPEADDRRLVPSDGPEPVCAGKQARTMPRASGKPGLLGSLGPSDEGRSSRSCGPIPSPGEAPAPSAAGRPFLALPLRRTSATNSHDSPTPRLLHAVHGLGPPRQRSLCCRQRSQAISVRRRFAFASAAAVDAAGSGAAEPSDELGAVTMGGLLGRLSGRGLTASDGEDA
jgi:hypothetical protein